MAKTIKANIYIRRDTAANWTANNPILYSGQEGYETDTRKLKIGRGVAWNSTDYIFADGYVPPTPVEIPEQGPGIIMSDIPTGFTKYDARLFKDDIDGSTDPAKTYLADVTAERLRLDYGGLSSTQIGVLSNMDVIIVRYSK